MSARLMPDQEIMEKKGMWKSGKREELRD